METVSCSALCTLKSQDLWREKKNLLYGVSFGRDCYFFVILSFTSRYHFILQFCRALLGSAAAPAPCPEGDDEDGEGDKGRGRGRRKKRGGGGQAGVAGASPRLPRQDYTALPGERRKKKFVSDLFLKSNAVSHNLRLVGAWH